MKILLINERLDFAGGAERYTVDIASGLTGLGHDVVVVYGLPPQPNFQFSARLPARQVFNFQSMMIEGLNVDGVKKEVARFNPDVINVQNIDDPKLLLALNRLKPTVRFIHDHRSYCPGNSKLWFSSDQVCPVAMGWNDVGSWAALKSLLPVDRSGNLSIGNNLLVESSGNIVKGSGRLIATVGLKDHVVVDTGDAVLVCPVGKTESIRKIVQELQKKHGQYL